MVNVAIIPVCLLIHMIMYSCAILTAFSARRFLFPSSSSTINIILYGLPAFQIAILQRVQNTAARLVYMSPKFIHISPYLKELHWLPVKFRIEFKITILTFQAIHGLAPKYLCELVRIKEQSPYHLRSSEEIILLQRSEKSLTRHRDTAFQFAAPRLWNRLPRDLKLVIQSALLKRNLKHIFLE